MSERSRVSILLEVIQKNRAVLSRLFGYYRMYLTEEMDPGNRKRSDAIVISDILTSYYTCLETFFLRISQFFENDLLPEKWHQDLLDHMVLSIEDVRERVISEEAYPLLAELLKFRHFKRYYFDIDYDWDKIEFLQKKFEQAHSLVQNDLDRFTGFLRRLIDQDPPSP